MNLIQALSRSTATIATLAAIHASAFDFHGYFRSGEGSNSKDGNQVCFGLPGISKYRLGNECDSYGELEFGDTVLTAKDGTEFKYHAMLGYATLQSQDFENLSDSPNHIALRQSWVEARKLPMFGGKASVWAGKRYYQRHDVHLTDFFYWNTSGPGAGIEGIDLGVAQFAFAVLRNNYDTTTNKNST